MTSSVPRPVSAPPPQPWTGLFTCLVRPVVSPSPHPQSQANPTSSEAVYTGFFEVLPNLEPALNGRSGRPESTCSAPCRSRSALMATSTLHKPGPPAASPSALPSPGRSVPSQPPRRLLLRRSSHQRSCESAARVPSRLAVAAAAAFRPGPDVSSGMALSGPDPVTQP